MSRPGRVVEESLEGRVPTGMGQCQLGRVWNSLTMQGRTESRYGRRLSDWQDFFDGQICRRQF